MCRGHDTIIEVLKMPVENYLSSSTNQVKMQNIKLIHRNGLLHSYIIKMEDQKEKLRK